MKDLSIIIPVKNREKCIGACLDSVLVQKSDNVEIIVVDDYSFDDTIDIVKDYQKGNPEIKLIDRKRECHNAPRGVASARNIGIKNATGKYVQFLDSDDVLDKNSIETVLKNFSPEIDLLIFGANIIDEKGILSKQDYEYTMNFYNSEFMGNQTISNDILIKMCTSSCNRVHRKDIIEKFNIQYPNIAALEDIVFVYHYLAHCNLIRYIPDKLYNYFQNNNSLMDKLRNTRNNNEFLSLIVFEKIIEYYIQQNIYEKYKVFLSHLLNKSVRDDEYYFAPPPEQRIVLFEQAKAIAAKYNLTLNI